MDGTANVIPGRSEAASPKPKNTNRSRLANAGAILAGRGVHGFRARGLLPRPGMTSG
jgi:hypothetical protein